MTDAADELIPGFAFLPTAEPIPHLTFVASYPNDDDEVVILSFTTRRDYSDSSVIVTTTDHAWLKHESVVDFGKARLEPRALLHRSLTLGLIQRRDALSSTLLKRVQDAAVRSINTSRRIKRCISSSM